MNWERAKELSRWLWCHVFIDMESIFFIESGYT